MQVPPCPADPTMLEQLRFLLASHCSAHCAYCHNEGQAAQRRLLNPALVTHVLDTLDAAGVRVGEIVLSGGEPTLHPHLPAIARRCKASAALVSMNTHGGHPGRLARALPWLDEVKIHVDSFDAERQRLSMGISIAQVRKSVALAQRSPSVRTLLNHPLVTPDETCAFIAEARSLGVNCKVIALLGASCRAPKLHDLPWAQMGYQRENAQTWVHINGTHSVHGRRCYDLDRGDRAALFVGPDGFRLGLTGAHLESMEAVSRAMLTNGRISAFEIVARRDVVPA